MFFEEEKTKKQKNSEKFQNISYICMRVLNLKHHFEEHRTFSMFVQFLTMIKKLTKHHANDTS